MRTLHILLISVLFSSCSVKKNIVVKSHEIDHVVSSDNDTIKIRKRLFDFIEVGGVYDFRMIKDRCVDLSVNKNTKTKKH